MPRGFYKSGIRKGRRKGSPRIVNKRSWLKRSSYSLRLAVGLLSGGSLWKNDGSGAIDNPWDNSKFWNN